MEICTYDEGKPNYQRADVYFPCRILAYGQINHPCDHICWRNLFLRSEALYAFFECRIEVNNKTHPVIIDRETGNNANNRFKRPRN